MSAFSEQLYLNRLLDTFPQLQAQLALLSKQGFTPTLIEPINVTSLINVATNPSFDLLEFVANTTYFIYVAAWSKYSLTQTGAPFLDIYLPFANTLAYRYGGSSLPNNTVTLNLGFPAFNILTSRIQWNDNGATVGTFSVWISALKITYK